MFQFRTHFFIFIYKFLIKHLRDKSKQERCAKFSLSFTGINSLCRAAEWNAIDEIIFFNDI